MNTIIKEILENNKLTTGNKNTIIEKVENLINDFCKSNNVCFVKDDKKKYWQNNAVHYNNDIYIILKPQNDSIEQIEIPKNEISQNVNVNDIVKIENDQIIVDKEKTNNLKSEIYNMVQEIVDEQNSNLNQYRKEGHLYFVCEEIKENRFLRDITENSKYEFEEVNIPEELLDKATEGTILEFTNGKYEFYSENGYDLTE